MAITLKQDLPFGGGLGNKKVMLVTLDGTYATGGFALFKEAPAFAVADSGYIVAFNASTGKTQIKTAGGSIGGEVVIPEQTVSGIEFKNAAAITGTVADTTATIAVEDAVVGGNVTIPTQTVSVTGASASGAGEVPNDTDLTGVKIFAIL